MEWERTGVKKPNLVLLLACIIGAVLGWFLAEFLYGLLPASTPAVLQSAVYFAALLLMTAAAAFFSELAVCHVKRSWEGYEIARSLLFLLACVVVFGLLAMLFQFIYGLGFRSRRGADIDDYLFVVDNSGSTDVSDPDGQRFSQIEALVRKMDAGDRFSITVFDHEVKGSLPLTVAGADSLNALVQFNSQMAALEKGGTELQMVLTEVINGYTDSGRSAAVFLLSDGESGSPVDYRSLSDQFSDKNLPIYAVAFANMGSDGVKTLTRLSEDTDGYYCEIDDLDNLQDTIREMLELTSKRSLLERRRAGDASNILAMILRVLFVTILGVLVELALALILDCEPLLKGAMLIHALFSLLAGLVAEFVTQLIGAGGFTRLLMCVLMAVVLASWTEYRLASSGPFTYDDNYSEPQLAGRKSKTASNVKKKRTGSGENKSLL